LTRREPSEMRAVVIDIDHYRMQQETRLYFIRHGETDYNRRRIVQGRRINCGLNATGRVQARALAARMASVPVDAIYTSTLLRAQETASHIAERHPKAPLYALADLEEMSWGIYEGEPLSEAVLEAFDEMHARWARDEYMHRIEGGESILDVQARGLRAVEHILHRHVGEVVAVVKNMGWRGCRTSSTRIRVSTSCAGRADGSMPIASTARSTSTGSTPS
jgi:broad specificity phosphatase PhoE